MGAGANLREWKSLKALQELNLKGCYKIEDAGLQGLALMTSLTSLNLQECWQITAQGLAAISGAPAHSLVRAVLMQHTHSLTFNACLSALLGCLLLRFLCQRSSDRQRSTDRCWPNVPCTIYLCA